MPSSVRAAGLAALFIVTVSIPRLGPCAAPPPRDPSASVTELAEAARERWGAAGVAVAVVRVGVEVDVVVGVGVEAVGSTAPVSPQSRFALGTADAPFTAAVAARLAERGLLAWDSPLGGLLPAPLLPDPESASRITLRDLLLHRTGVGGKGLGLEGGAGNAEGLLLEAASRPPLAPFRTGFRFSRINLIAARAAMERVTGIVWPQLLEREILAPLGIVPGAGLAEALDLPRRSHPGGDLPPSARPLAATPGPAAELELSALDLARWFHALLENRPPLLGDDARRELRSPGPALSGGPDEAPLALAIAGGLAQPYRGRRLEWHDGVAPGSAAALMLLPDDGLAVAVLTDLPQTGLPVALARQLLDLAFGRLPEPWHARPPSDLAGPTTWSLPAEGVGTPAQLEPMTATAPAQPGAPSGH